MESCWRRSLRFRTPVSQHRDFLTTAPGSSGGPSGGATHFYPQLSGLGGGPFFPLPLVHPRWTVPSAAITRRVYVPVFYCDKKSRVTVSCMEINGLNAAYGELHVGAFRETLACSLPPFLWRLSPPIRDSHQYFRVCDWTWCLSIKKDASFAAGYCSFIGAPVFFRRVIRFEWLISTKRISFCLLTPHVTGCWYEWREPVFLI